MSNALKTGARIRMNQDYGSTANKGDMGTVRELRNGFTGIDFDNGQSHTGVCNSRFYVVNDTSTAHVFKLGDTGVTRDGRKYEVLAVFPNRSRSLIADVDGMVRDFYSSGRRDENIDTHIDLIPPKQTCTIYLNVSAKGRVTGHYTTSEQARSMASAYAVVIAHPVTIELP
jgi:hypothetical protein